MESKKIKDSYYMGSIRIDSNTKHFYITNNFIFEAEPPTIVVFIEQEELRTYKMKANPWRNWMNKNPELIIAKRTGLPINHLKTTRNSNINKEEDRNLVNLYSYVIDEFDSQHVITMSIVSDWHYRLFNGIYPFAGNYRTVDMQKGKDSTAMTWLLRFLDNIPELDNLLNSLSKASNLSIKDLTFKISEFICEFLFIHPYREGNGRLSRLVADYFLVKNGFPPIGANLTVDPSAYIEKLHIGYKQKDYEPLSGLITEKVEKAILLFEKRNTH